MTLANELAKSLKQALRYIEVKLAYSGAMTAAQVEARIKNNVNIASTSIGANSVTTLATFDIAKARELLKQAEKERTEESGTMVFVSFNNLAGLKDKLYSPKPLSGDEKRDMANMLDAMLHNALTEEQFHNELDEG